MKIIIMLVNWLISPIYMIKYIIVDFYSRIYSSITETHCIKQYRGKKYCLWVNFNMIRNLYWVYILQMRDKYDDIQKMLYCGHRKKNAFNIYNKYVRLIEDENEKELRF